MSLPCSGKRSKRGERKLPSCAGPTKARVMRRAKAQAGVRCQLQTWLLVKHASISVTPHRASWSPALPGALSAARAH